MHVPPSSRSVRKSRPKLRPKPNSKPLAAAQPDDNLPCWMPDGADVTGFPKKVQESLVRMTNQTYRAFVLNASGELERTIGNSLVYLAWLEMVHQIRLANVMADPRSPDAILNDPDALTDRCLELMNTKCHTAELMLKTRMASEALNRLTALETQDRKSQEALTNANIPPSADTQDWKSQEVLTNSDDPLSPDIEYRKSQQALTKLNSPISPKSQNGNSSRG